MQRRDFLQMLGIGGAALAVSPTVVPLFSGKDSKIWTPEHTSLTRSHIVLVRPRHDSWKWPTAETTDGAPTLLRHLDGWGENPPTARVEFDEGQDPHHAFYRAAMRMREDFAKESQRRLMALPEWRRPHSILVTLVDTPIFAGAMPSGPGKEQLLAEISYTPYVIDTTAEFNANGWGVYSENGEYPIEVPSQIDMDQLLSLDYRIVRGETTLSRFGGKLLIG